MITKIVVLYDTKMISYGWILNNYFSQKEYNKYAFRC